MTLLRARLSAKTGRVILLLCAFVSVTACFSEAQEAGKRSDKQVEYRLVSTTKAATFERELNEVAKQGFKVEIVAQSMRLSSLTVLVSRAQAADQGPQFEYRLIDPGQFKKQKEDLGKAGFVYRGSLWATALLGLGSPPFILLERQLAATHSPNQFELVEAKKEKELQQKMNEVAAAGFVPVSVSPVNILLQRDSSTTARKPDYRLLEVYRMSTLEKEMNSSAKEGYRFRLCGALNSVIMTRKLQSQESTQYEYRLVSLEESEQSQHRLATVAGEGFNFLGVTQLGLTAIFERQPKSPDPNKRVEFKVLETTSAATMEKELAEVTAQGFVPLSLGHGAKGWLSILLSREGPQT